MKDDVFRLVKSLDARENRAMNKFFNDSNGRKHLLFVKLKRQQKYDEEPLKKALFGKDAPAVSRQFSVLKRQLFEDILEQISSVHIPTAKQSKHHPSYEMTIRQWFDHIEVLQLKGMYEQSLQYIDKVKKLAYLAEDWGYVFQLLKYEGYGKSKLYPNDIKRQTPALAENSKMVSDNIRGFADIYRAKTTLHAIMLSDPLVRTEEQTEAIRAALDYSVPEGMKATYYYKLFSRVIAFFGDLLLGNYGQAATTMQQVYAFQNEGEGHQAALLKPFEWFQSLFFYAMGCVFAGRYDALRAILDVNDDEYLGQYKEHWHFYRAHYELIYFNRQEPNGTAEANTAFQFYQGIVEGGELGYLPIEMQKVLVHDLQITCFNAGKQNESARLYDNIYLNLPENNLRLDIDTSARYLYLFTLSVSAANLREMELAQNHLKRAVDRINKSLGEKTAKHTHQWDLLFLQRLKEVCQGRSWTDAQRDSAMAALRALDDQPYVKYINRLFPFNDKLEEYLAQ